MTQTQNNRRVLLTDVMRTAAAPVMEKTSGASVEAAEVADANALPVPLPQSVIDWLAQASLLYGVPFEYLVPQARMLPRESIRFFYIDTNWLHRLVEGAVSIGMSSSADTVQLMGAIEKIVDQAMLGTSGVRAKMRGKPAAPAGQTVGPITGFLLRSAAVSGWPGMEISAYAGTTADSQKLPLLRLDRLSDNILIALFEGLPKRVDILQPPESLHFGIRPDGSDYYSFLRWLSAGGSGNDKHAAGEQIGSVEAPVAMRSNTAHPGVLDITKTAENLKAALKKQSALDPQDTFTSAEFAVQMVRSAGLQSFEWGVASPLNAGSTPQ
ncbi:hypothetical protein [Roseovarius sp. M141]|uniref:hypothetical protein n=1 Tax=Roseovarius sp. M141 TaxID=2583806 RepID=UPI0020CD261D|nr:hypothetical protein [Roseovarius sp. M141]MCQ0090817.1 hypothetical protein [Roseovarius sp. M141]